MGYQEAGKSVLSRRGTVRAAVGAAVVIAAGLGVMSTPAHADTLVGCDTSGLISAITTANSAGGGTLDLATGCTYTLESGPYSDGNGGNGLPVSTSAITIHGNGATIIRDSSAPAFRLIEVAGSGSLTADHLTLSQGNAGNLPGGGIYNLGSLTLTNSTVSGNSGTGGANDGGGIFNSGTATLTNSTVSGNTAPSGSGGGIYTAGTVTVTNTTVSGNTASNGGGIYTNTGGTVTITNTTVSGNSADAGSGGGIANAGNPATLTNTIVANSPAGGNCGGLPAPTDGGYNLDSGTTCGMSQPTSKSNVDPQLGPLQGNGGPTATMALASASPAIDAIPSGTNGCGTTITIDQRGAPRPQEAACDIGAYESGDLAMQSLTANRNPVPTLSKLTYTAAVSNDGPADGTGITVTDTVPVGEKVKSASASQGSCSIAVRTVTCNLGQVPAAATAKVTIVVKVKAARGSMLSDTATVSATTGDTIPGNDSKTLSVTVS